MLKRNLILLLLPFGTKSDKLQIHQDKAFDSAEMFPADCISEVEKLVCPATVFSFSLLLDQEKHVTQHCCTGTSLLKDRNTGVRL